MVYEIRMYTELLDRLVGAFITHIDLYHVLYFAGYFRANTEVCSTKQVLDRGFIKSHC